MAKQYYMFLNYRDGELISNNERWRIGKEYSVEGAVEANDNGFCVSKHIQSAFYDAPEVSALAVLEISGDYIDKSQTTWCRAIKIVKAYAWTIEDSIHVAIYAAEQVLKYFEQYCNDKRPREAIRAAKVCLKDASKREAAKVAASAAFAAAEEAKDTNDAAEAAAYAAGDVALAASEDNSSAAGAAIDAAALSFTYAVGTNTYDPTDNAAYHEMNLKIHHYAKTHLNELLEIE